jgi:hypothetical protein
MPESEVARLMNQIAAEYQAAQAVMSGLAMGTAQHAFITARLENMRKCQEELNTIVGEQEAIKVESIYVLEGGSA